MPKIKVSEYDYLEQTIKRMVEELKVKNFLSQDFKFLTKAEMETELIASMEEFIKTSCRPDEKKHRRTNWKTEVEWGSTSSPAISPVPSYKIPPPDSNLGECRGGLGVTQVNLKVKVDGYPDVLKALERLEDRLKEARILGNELASFLEKLQIQIQDKQTASGGKDAEDELATLAKPLTEYLRNNHHPHTAIVITDERAVVVEDIIGVPFPIED